MLIIIMMKIQNVMGLDPDSLCWYGRFFPPFPKVNESRSGGYVKKMIFTYSLSPPPVPPFIFLNSSSLPKHIYERMVTMGFRSRGHLVKISPSSCGCIQFAGICSFVTLDPIHYLFLYWKDRIFITLNVCLTSSFLFISATVPTPYPY